MSEKKMSEETLRAIEIIRDILAEVTMWNIGSIFNNIPEKQKELDKIINDNKGE